MKEDGERVRKDIEQLLTGLRQDLVQGSVTLFREYLAPDAIILALDNPSIFKGKESCLEYIRLVEQQAKLKRLDATNLDIKIPGGGDVAIVLERAESRYEVRGQAYRDTSRTTWVLARDGAEGRWRVTHVHLESLAPNRIVNADGGGG